SKPHLPDGRDWLDMGRWNRTIPHSDRIAIHEAGHAAICILERIKVEYVTIVPHKRRNEMLSGACQTDYNIVAMAQTTGGSLDQLCSLAEQHIKFFWGGIAAEKRFLRENGLPIEPLHEFSWSNDEAEIERRITYRAKHLQHNAMADRA